MPQDSDEYTFTLTDKAVDAVRTALQKRETPEAFLRVGVRGGGCSGFMYSLEYWDDPPRDKDLLFEFDDVKVIIDKKSIIYLNGAKLDWEETLMKKGYKFNNPQEKSSCGCNLSFEI